MEVEILFLGKKKIVTNSTTFFALGIALEKKGTPQKIRN